MVTMLIEDEWSLKKIFQHQNTNLPPPCSWINRIAKCMETGIESNFTEFIQIKTRDNL
jgi:hypothetical protein